MQLKINQNDLTNEFIRNILIIIKSITTTVTVILMIRVDGIKHLISTMIQVILTNAHIENFAFAIVITIIRIETSMVIIISAADGMNFKIIVISIFIEKTIIIVQHHKFGQLMNGIILMIVEIIACHVTHLMVE